MDNTKELAVIDFMYPSLYLFSDLHPLYIKLAEAEKKVYSSLFGKKKKAEAVKIGYERALGLAAHPLSELSSKMHYAVKDAPKSYADRMIRLYHLYIDMVESRINLLEMFMDEGLTDKVKNYNQNVALNKCSDYDALYVIMQDETNNYYQMYKMIGMFDNT